MTNRDRIVIVVVGIVAVIAASWLLVISPQRDQASQLQSQIDSTRSALSAAQAVTDQGVAARRSFQDSYAELVRLGEAVPTDDDVPSLIYQIQSAASRTGVDFLGLSLDPSGVSGTPTPSTTAGSPSTSSTPGSTTPPAPTSSAPVTGSSTSTGLPPGAAVGPAGFPVEPFSFTFQGDFFHLANFFARLERFVVATDDRLEVSGRLLSLNAINLASGTGGFPQITATVSATAYLLPASQGLVDGATAAGPAGSAAPAASAPPSGVSSAAAPPAAAVVASGEGG